MRARVSLRASAGNLRDEKGHKVMHGNHEFMTHTTGTLHAYTYASNILLIKARLSHAYIIQILKRHVLHISKITRL